jgi:hypothetical protein
LGIVEWQQELDKPLHPRRAKTKNDTGARFWHPWRRISRVLRVILHTRWSSEAWSVVRVEFRRAVALHSEIRRAGVVQLGG